jgi:hypothetical protein
MFPDPNAQSDLQRTREWSVGSFGEDTVRDFLVGVGLAVIPLSKIQDGGAPSMHGCDGERITLPDFEIYCRNQTSCFVEVKTKSRAHWYKGVYKHGIDLKSWAQYLATTRTTGKPVLLAIWEVSTNTLLAQFCRVLETCEHDTFFHKAYDGWMINFRRDDFVIVTKKVR